MIKKTSTHCSVLFFWALFIMCLTSCNSKSDGDHDGTYEGQIISKTVQNRNDNVQTFIDTIEVTVTFRSDSFEVGDCSGSVSTGANSMLLASEDCDCWCDCDPSVDCGGHPILGDYTILNDQDTLVLRAFYEQESFAGDFFHKWSLEKTATFYK